MGSPLIPALCLTSGLVLLLSGAFLAWSRSSRFGRGFGAAQSPPPSSWLMKRSKRLKAARTSSDELSPALLLHLMAQLTRTGAGHAQSITALAAAPGVPEEESETMRSAAAALGLGLDWNQAWALAAHACESSPRTRTAGGRASDRKARRGNAAETLERRSPRRLSGLPPASRRIRDAVHLSALTGAAAHASLEASAHSCQRLWKSTALAQAQRASVSILMPLAAMHDMKQDMS